MENYSSDHGKQDVTELEFIVKDTQLCVFSINTSKLEIGSVMLVNLVIRLHVKTALRKQQSRNHCFFLVKIWIPTQTLKTSKFCGLIGLQARWGWSPRHCSLRAGISHTHTHMYMYSSTNYVIKISEFAYLNESKWYQEESQLEEKQTLTHKSCRGSFKILSSSLVM